MFWNTKKFNREIDLLKAAHSGPVLHPLRKEQIKQALLQQLKTETNPAAQRYTRHERNTKFMRYIIATLLGLSVLGGTAFAAGNAKPGDTLFPVKKITEQIRLHLAVSEEAKAGLQAKFAQERLSELADIQAHASATTTTSSALHAKTEAEGEVSHALSALQEVRAKLQAKGNAEAAAAIQKTIVQLQNSIPFGVHNETEEQNGDGNFHDNAAATTTQDLEIGHDGGKDEALSREHLRLHADATSSIESSKDGGHNGIRHANDNVLEIR